MLAAAQGVEFHRPQKSSPAIEAVIASLREVSPAFVDDRSLSFEITQVADLIDDGQYCEHAASVLPSLGA
jgi:histidine ammonia-lyase